MNNKYYKKIRKIQYDKSLINKIIKEFKGLNPKDVYLFIDMDNTLFIYSKDSNDELSLELQNQRGFFKNLEPYQGAPEILFKLKEMGFNVRILSACMDNDYCEEEKRESLYKHFPFIKDDEMIFTKHGENKAERIKSMGIDLNKSILLDDYYVNLINWMEIGGLAIKKTYSGKKRPIPQVKYFHEMFVILEKIL